MRFNYNLDEYIDITMYACSACHCLPKLKKYSRYPWPHSPRILNLNCECSRSELEIKDNGFSSMVELLLHWNKIHTPRASI